VSELEEKLEVAIARIAKLEEKTRQHSSNSSRPPSSDPPDTPPRKRRKRSGRRRGGQPGHQGHNRPLLPVEKVDQLIVAKPERCDGCGARLPARDDPDPLRHQIVEVPEPKVEVTELQRHAVECARCGTVTRAPYPEGLPTGAFGPRIQAMVAVSTGFYRLSKRMTQSLMADFHGVSMSLGSIIACEQGVSSALAAPVKEARRYVQDQSVVHADETGWREGARKAWLWVATTPLVVVFLVHASRGSVAARELLGAFAGILVSDRWSAYNGWLLRFRQLCWAHLKRDFTWISERGGKATRIGMGLLAEVERLFHLWHRVRDGTLKRSSFRIYMGEVRRRTEALLKEGSACGHAGVEGKCRAILKLRKALWTFVRVEGVEPTNNAGERDIRHGVIWRKISFGTDSARGSRFVERILTVVISLKKQNRNVVDYITQVCHAALHGQSAPSILPAAATATAPAKEKAA
jgi:transposase